MRSCMALVHDIQVSSKQEQGCAESWRGGTECIRHNEKVKPAN